MLYSTMQDPAYDRKAQADALERKYGPNRPPREPLGKEELMGDEDLIAKYKPHRQNDPAGVPCNNPTHDPRCVRYRRTGNHYIPRNGVRGRKRTPLGELKEKISQLNEEQIRGVLDFIEYELE